MIASISIAAGYLAAIILASHYCPAVTPLILLAPLAIHFWTDKHDD